MAWWGVLPATPPPREERRGPKDTTRGPVPVSPRDLGAHSVAGQPPFQFQQSAFQPTNFETMGCIQNAGDGVEQSESVCVFINPLKGQRF